MLIAILESGRSFSPVWGNWPLSHRGFCLPLDQHSRVIGWTGWTCVSFYKLIHYVLGFLDSFITEF